MGSPPQRTMSESESMATTHSSSASSLHSHSRSYAVPTISSSSSEAASSSGKGTKTSTTSTSVSSRSSTSSAAAYPSIMRIIYSGETSYGPVPRKDVPLITTTPPTLPQSAYAGDEEWWEWKRKDGVEIGDGFRLIDVSCRWTER
jgi:hypothetical protein